MKALEKDRTRRYATASEFAADLARYLHHEPVLASPPVAVYRLGKLMRRHRGVVTSGVLVFLVLVAGLIAGLAWRGRKQTFNLYWLLAAAAGTVLMCAGYLAAGTLMVGFGAAVVELPGNLLQNLAGVIGAVPLTIAVRKAYPPVTALRW